MSDVPSNGGLSGLRSGQVDRTPTGEPLTRTGAAADQGTAFNAALAEGPSRASVSDAPVRQDVPVRPDLAFRPDATARSEPLSRPNVAANADASSLSGRDSEALDGAKRDLPVLQLGSTAKAVGLLQRALAVLGYETLRADNIFGPKTDEATRAFQGSKGLTADGVAGNRETWPALNQTLVTRHEGVTRLADAMGPTRAMAEPQVAEQKQLSAVLAEFSGERTALQVPVTVISGQTHAVDAQQNGEANYTVRGGETLSDVARMFNLPVSALILANPELAKPYLILQGQLLILPNPVRERRYRRPPRQLHPADPEGHLANPNMNPEFVTLVNDMIAQLRGEGHDVRVIAGYRSFTEQQWRFEQGRQTPGLILTNAEAGHSWHNYGLAADIVLNDDDGTPAWPEDSMMFWQRLGDVALAHGAVWGGLFGYPDHVEFHPQHEREEAGSLIEDFESDDLARIWERIALALPPEI